MKAEPQSLVTNPAFSDPVIKGSTKTFFYTLDGIRGIAALLIVLRHTEGLFFPFKLQESYLAVDVFFVLSGVVISQAYGERLNTGMSFLDFATIRVVRIMPLYLLGTFISLLGVASGLVAFGPLRLIILYTVLGIFMVPNPGIGTINVYPLNNPAWSLPLELVVNLFYAKFIGVLSMWKITIVMAFSALGMVFTLYQAQSHSLNIGFWARSFPFGIFRVGYSFFAGVMIFSYYSVSRKHRSDGWSTVFSWAILLVVGVLFACNPNHRWQPYYDLAAVTCVFPGLVYLALIVQPVGISAAACRFLGAISYAVYTLHAPVSGFIEGLYHQLFHSSLSFYSPYTGIIFLIALALTCTVVDRLYDQPIRRFLLLRYLPRRMTRQL